MDIEFSGFAVAARTTYSAFRAADPRTRGPDNRCRCSFKRDEEPDSPRGDVFSMSTWKEPSQPHAGMEAETVSARAALSASAERVAPEGARREGELAISERTARQFYAEELRFTANISSRAVIDAFATVPRECFVGPGPWRILSPMRSRDYWTTADADPRHVYHDVLIALDEARGINNGQPSLWAKLYDQLNLSAGAHVVHVGAGAGYYSAVLAEIVGRSGHVTAIEIDPDLAGRARNNLISWPQATVVVADGFAFHGDRPANAIVVNAGVTHVSMTWLDMLSVEHGRLLVPLSNSNGWGGFLLIERHAAETRRYSAQHVSATGIIPCIGGRDPAAEERLDAALARSRMTDVRSLRRAPDAPDETCWLAGDGWWLSTATVDGSQSS
jgi:protein-L-isoaspartate(D-aspartate) O-methyltransferase